MMNIQKSVLEWTSLPKLGCKDSWKPSNISLRSVKMLSFKEPVLEFLSLWPGKQNPPTFTMSRCIKELWEQELGLLWCGAQGTGATLANHSSAFARGGLRQQEEVHKLLRGRCQGQWFSREKPSFVFKGQNQGRAQSFSMTLTFRPNSITNVTHSHACPGLGRPVKIRVNQCCREHYI